MVLVYSPFASNPSSSQLLSLAKPLIPYLPLLPRPLLTLPPSLFLHLTTSPSLSPWSFLVSPTTHSLHLPIILTILLVPTYYLLGLLSGNVSWVDRSWPFYTPLCSGLILLYAAYNPSAEVYAHNLPRLTLMMALQLLWSARLTRHAIRRGFYDLRGEDYRYTTFRRIVPSWLFHLVHPFVIALAQPILLLSLSLPMHAVLTLPPSELSPQPIPSLSIPFRAVLPYLPKRLHSANPYTPILNLADISLALIALGLLYIEYRADETMYAYQTAKHSAQAKSKSDMVLPNAPNGQNPASWPEPTAYPRDFHPGFPTKGLYRWSRHPNFAAEQLFWLTQTLFVVAAGESSGVTRTGWVGGSVFAGSFALSILFCASTFLTEWITTQKYPAYRSYRRLVGEFLPQETFLLWLWGTLRGKRLGLEKEVYMVPPRSSGGQFNKTE
ncbi:hypothetical protein EHS25_009083 [Saitozyma podzolica]|uniref:Steroid 5-alpha reductase C-terminal domain-containing protein n=1 Tax=Saitozyma podzolica TaxID=1890683 RepID=A0A427YKT9_9TREE|nr:hypothetical protein EHS25_009083 [Saitozyma podzolica]